MAFILANNILDNLQDVSFRQSTSENALFPFTRAFDGNASTGFKSNSANSPNIVIRFTTPQTINAVGLFAARSSNFTLQVFRNATSTQDDTHAGWVQMPFNAAESSLGNAALNVAAGGSKTSLTVTNDKSAIVGVSETKTTDTRSVKLVFSGFGVTGDVLNHLQIGDAKVMDITPPYAPAMFRNFQTTMKRNNLGNPMIGDSQPTPVKLNLKTPVMTPAEMKTFVDSIYDGIFNKGFMFTTSQDLLAEDISTAYYCMIDKSLGQPRYIHPNAMTWSVKVLGYN